MKNVLVTGGAGYIGSHACKALKIAGYNPVTFDNLVTGWADAVRFGPFEQGDIFDAARLDEVFARWQPVAVMHFAALSQVGEAMQEPGRYWRSNLVASLTLIEAAVRAGCLNFVFSSTCAVYGDQDGVVIDENTVQSPINAYGASKRAIEDVLRNFGHTYGLRSIIFRYFNVAGADPTGELSERHVPETHLIPILLEVAKGKRDHVKIFGSDYATPDGTCIRDYIHVADLVDAHLLGLQWLEAGRGSNVFCLGSGHGYSVRQVVEEARSIVGHPIPVIMADRRAGDAASLVCGSQHALQQLGWAPQRSLLPIMIEDAWRSMG
ncbi:UDP-glucose 4-epimerase GalE [Ancylobacter sp. G4_0304]|uniref:UDP-glucose 4-epimerase GalE n=1 Tax=Ancylobacter sp. G4_0304 TaxID=3114289 RepID=UPI0039C6C1A4